MIIFFDTRGGGFGQEPSELGFFAEAPFAINGQHSIIMVFAGSQVFFVDESSADAGEFGKFVAHARNRIIALCNGVGLYLISKHGEKTDIGMIDFAGEPSPADDGYDRTIIPDPNASAKKHFYLPGASYAKLACILQEKGLFSGKKD